MRYIELGHQITDGMDVFPGLERPRITAFRDHAQSRALYEEQAEFYISKVELVGNTATYLDSPFHRHRDRRDLAGIPLEDVAGLPGVVLDGTVGADRAVTVEADESQLEGRAVLVRTGWMRAGEPTTTGSRGRTSHRRRSTSCSGHGPGSSASTSGTSTTRPTRAGASTPASLPRTS